MEKNSSNVVEFPAERPRDILTEILREKAQEMLAIAIEGEAGEWISRSRSCSLADNVSVSFFIPEL